MAQTPLYFSVLNENQTWNAKSEKNVFYSAYLKSKVQFNDVDPDKYMEFGLAMPIENQEKHNSESSYDSQSETYIICDNNDNNQNDNTNKICQDVEDNFV